MSEIVLLVIAPIIIIPVPLIKKGKRRRKKVLINGAGNGPMPNTRQCVQQSQLIANGRL